ncbi:MAG: hypothetical protein Unbinned1473contig1002_22 [Prokaryotic dsDNA virus sp.]|nr:MAG: hypothetical protein Unbinned1473contig1002_22 [Prokaryotic dsDNA virus sp.]|tara:strand:- start:406 stop:588 length:183 start_codon:yes stop_codon:yes gene_type:complete
MSKIKEKLLYDHIEYEEDFARYYSDMYMTAEYMGAQKVFDKLYKATIKITKNKKNNYGRK